MSNHKDYESYDERREREYFEDLEEQREREYYEELERQDMEEPDADN